MDVVSERRLSVQNLRSAIYNDKNQRSHMEVKGHTTDLKIILSLNSKNSCIMLMRQVCCLLSMSIDIHVQCLCCRLNHCMNLKAS